MKPFFCTISLLAFMVISSRAQGPAKDSAINAHLIYPTYSFGMPGADMAERFGFSHQVGAGYMYKAVNGWSLSVEGNVIFRDGVKNSRSILSGDSLGILTNDGFVIDESGTFANVMLSERGYTLWLKVGKLLPVIGPNPNSGLLIQLGAGMLQHKIRIDVPGNTAPQLLGDYKKGYDLMCNGPAFSEFFGYQHLANNMKVNFFAGFEFVQAFTQSRRSYYFAQMKRPDEKRIDLLSSAKVGWYIPINRKTQKRYYYY